MKKRKVKDILKYTFAGFFLLLLLHFESINIGPVKISHLWKGVLLMFFLVKILNLRKRQNSIYKPIILLAILQLLNADILNNTISSIVGFSTILIFALTGLFVFKYDSKKLERLLLFFTSFFILSFLPYKLGMLNSIGEGYDLKGYGVETIGLIGPFQKVHAASATLATSLLVILFFLLSNKFNKTYLLILFILGFYFLFYTYVRTGMAMFAFGALPLIYSFAKKSVKSFTKVFVFGALTFVLLSTWVLSNETLLRRITGERDYYQEDSIETIGSGRVLFIITSVEIFMEENIYEKFIGIGEIEQLNRMEEKIGLRLFPHNGLLLLLLANGLFGLLVFLRFIKKVYYLQKKSLTKEAILLKSLLFSYIVLTFLQSYDMYYPFVLLTLVIALNREKLNNNTVQIK